MSNPEVSKDSGEFVKLEVEADANAVVDVAEAVVEALSDDDSEGVADAQVPSSRDLVFQKASDLNVQALGEHELDAWIEALREELKVGLIIDGQHRVLGTKHKNIPFLIAALPDAGWQELAFQFIVLNSTARTVKEALLINIIGTSLDLISHDPQPSL
jgi:hypothetical protein